MAAPEVSICTRPECDQPGPHLCASCRLVRYCCRTCQVDDWPRHKEVDCQGHFRKVGMAHLQKAEKFDEEDNFVQSLRYSELALVKLKKLNDRPIEEIDSALHYKFDALNFMDRNREALECASERYCLYLTSHTHPPAINASFDLIESCIHNKEFEDAALYARTTWETITLSNDCHIPDNRRDWFTAQGAYYLAFAMLSLAQDGDIPPEENQAVAREAIGLARRALEIHTQLNGLEHIDVAHDRRLLARALDYFNNVDDIEVLRLYEQSIAITTRAEGSMSVNVAVGEEGLANAYRKRAIRARGQMSAEHHEERVLVNLELSLTHVRNASGIYRSINRAEDADRIAKNFIRLEKNLRQCRIAKSEADTASS